MAFTAKFQAIVVSNLIIFKFIIEQHNFEFFNSVKWRLMLKISPVTLVYERHPGSRCKPSLAITQAGKTRPSKHPQRFDVKLMTAKTRQNQEQFAAGTCSASMTSADPDRDVIFRGFWLTNRSFFCFPSRFSFVFLVVSDFWRTIWEMTHSPRR